MQWDTPHRRGAGLAIEVIRFRWVYAILIALHDFMHLRPVEIFDLIEGANEKNEPTIGSRRLKRDAVTQKISALQDDGLIVRCAESSGYGPRMTYEITRLGAELVGCLNALEEWSMDHYEYLVRSTRLRYELDPDGPVAAPDREDSYTRRTGLGMALGVMNARWAFTVLVMCANEPIRPSELERIVNNGMAREFATKRRLTATPRHDALNWLTRIGLIAKTTASEPKQAPQVSYQTTPLGDSLLDALWPLAEFGIRRHEILDKIIQARPNWTEDEH